MAKQKRKTYIYDEIRITNPPEGLVAALEKDAEENGSTVRLRAIHHISKALKVKHNARTTGK